MDLRAVTATTRIAAGILGGAALVTAGAIVGRHTAPGPPPPLPRPVPVTTGWLLLQPLVRNGEVHDYSLHTWDQIMAFDTARECEQGKRAEAEAADRRMREYQKRGKKDMATTALDVYLGVESAVCVVLGDPRLDK